MRHVVLYAAVGQGATMSQEVHLTRFYSFFNYILFRKSSHEKWVSSYTENLKDYLLVG